MLDSVVSFLMDNLFIVSIVSIVVIAAVIGVSLLALLSLPQLLEYGGLCLLEKQGVPSSVQGSADVDGNGDGDGDAEGYGNGEGDERGQDPMNDGGDARE
jgi:hypothetical protein